MMEASNIEQLFETLNKNILSEAINYKSEKPKKLLVKYFELEIIEKVNKKLLPNIAHLKQELQKQQEILERKKSFLQTTLISDINFQISFLVKKYEDSKNTQKLVQELNQYIIKKFNHEVSKILSELFDNIQKTSIRLNLNNISKYKNVEFTYTIEGEERGFFEKVTSWDFSDREDDNTRTEVIGVDGSAVQNSLIQNSSKEIQKSIEHTFYEFHLTFNSIISSINKIEKDIDLFKTKIEVLKNDK